MKSRVFAFKLPYREPIKDMGKTLMATATRAVNSSGDFRNYSAGRRFSVARRPILDLRGRVHGYELLFGGRPQLQADGEQADSAFYETVEAFGLVRPSELKKLTGRLTGFVNCAGVTLSDKLAQVLPSSLTVLEISADLNAGADVVAACGQLKSMGFRLALDDFAGQPQSEALLHLADYIKIDVGQTRQDLRRELLNKLTGKSLAMVAKNVETQAEYRQARQGGFTLFEGYYFCQPVTTRNRRPPANQLLRIDILKALQHHPLDLNRVSQLVKRDGPLTYQLLRLVNSPLWAMHQAVASIEVALLAVGEDTFRRIAMLAIASEFNGDQPAELLCMAMVRGRFCEVAGSEVGLDLFAQYLLGLLSLLPAMQGQPMCEVARGLPLGDEIREALLGTPNRERALLGWLEQHERGDWAGCDAAALANGLDQEKLAKCYVGAVIWAEAALYSAR